MRATGMFKPLKRLLVVGVMSGALLAPAQASALDIAVFGDNLTDDLLSAQGHATTLVTDSQLATPGFLSSFDVVVYTRDGTSFGTSLSPAAAANVKAFAKRAVLLNGDFADTLRVDAEMRELVANTAGWAGADGGGYVGEFTGAAAGVTANADGLEPLGLVAGTAGQLGFSSLYGTITATTSGAGHPVLAGVALPRDPAEEEFGTQMTGVDAAQVLATYGNNNPAVIAGPTTRFTLTGFASPIDNDAINSAKAGQTIPIKYHVTDLGGDPVSDPSHFDSVTSQSVAGTCAGLPADAIEDYAGDSGLQYLGDGYWQFNWKTPKAYAGQCRRMTLRVEGGEVKTATFEFN